MGLITDDKNTEKEYFHAIDKFADWCSDHCLELNVTKTKELIIDFRTNPAQIDPVTIDNDAVEIIDNFKYLGLTLDSKLDFKAHVQQIQKKGQQRLHVIRRLSGFDLNPKLLQNLYRSIIEPILIYCGPIFYRQISTTDRNKIIKISNMAEKIYGKKNPPLTNLVDNATIRKAQSIVKNPNHPLFEEFEMLNSGRRYRTLMCKKAKFSRSFVPNAIKFLNQHMK